MPYAILLLLISLLGAGWHTWSAWGTSAQLREWNQRQEAQIEADRERFARQSVEIDKMRMEYQDLADQYARDIETKQGEIDDVISRHKDRPASDVIKRTIDKLRSGK